MLSSPHFLRVRQGFIGLPVQPQRAGTKVRAAVRLQSCVKLEQKVITRLLIPLVLQLNNSWPCVCNVATRSVEVVTCNL